MDLKVYMQEGVARSLDKRVRQFWDLAVGQICRQHRELD